MHKTMFMVTLVLGSMAWGQAQSPPALADQKNAPGQQQMPPATQPTGNANPVERIATFVSEDAVAVVRLDLPRVDPKAAEDWLRGFIEAAEPNLQLRQAQLTSLHNQSQAVQTWVSKMRQAGVNDVYAVFNRQPQPAQPQQAGEGQNAPRPAQQGEVLAATIVVPLKAGENAQVVQDLLLPKGQPEQGEPGQQPGTAVIRDAVVLAPKNMLERLQQPAKGDVQAVQRAMTSVEGSAIIVTLLPTAQMRQTATALVDQAGGGLPQGVTPQDLKAIPQELQWATIGLDTPPQQALKVVMQASNPQSAQSMSATLVKLLNAAKQNKELAAWMPNLEQAMNMLMPTAAGDRLTVTLNSQQMDQLFKQDIATAIRNARSEQPIRAGEMPEGQEGQEQQQPQETPPQQRQR